MSDPNPPAAASWSFPFCPEPPGWSLDFDALEAAFEWVGAMRHCPQHPSFHAEGDVLVHTRMVCEAMVESDLWRGLEPEDRSIVFAATLMHDVGKPLCTKREQGRISSRGHARHGARRARNILWRELPYPSTPEAFRRRESIVGLVRFHGRPLFFLRAADPQRAVIEAAQTARCDWLALLAEADARGRKCRDRQELLACIELFRDYAREQGCWDRPRAFPSDHGRFLYFHRPGSDPDFAAYDDTQLEAVIMSGLPGAGKDHWIAEHLPDRPVVSLDAVRSELNVAPEDDQGRVVNEAKRRAREHLRRREPFVWNGTNTTRPMRAQLIRLFHEYHARVRIVYLETTWDELLRRNGSRASPVPQWVLQRLARRLDVPDPTEAHGVEWHVSR